MAPPNTQYAILGNRLGFRLNYQSAALKAQRDTWTTFQLDGQPVTVRYQSVTIHDVINDTPNTCALTIDAKTPPTIGQRLTVRLNSNAPTTLFAGPLQTVGYTFELQPHQTVYPCQAIDDTPLANRKLPYGQWVNTSATTVAQWLVATFAPGFTAGAVQAGLPAVSVNFDATEGMDGCLRQLAKLIGGYFYWDDRVLHLFTDETTELPDPIDAAHPFLHDPPVGLSTDTSQLRTRVYGKGYAESIMADVAASDPIVPISNAVMFNPAGGQAVTETERLRYTGTVPAGGGTIVGPGIAPAAAPGAAILVGAGLTLGTHDYAISFVTAAGESLVGPRVTVPVVGTTGPPAGAPLVGPGTGPLGPLPGSYAYAVSYLTAAGETLVGPGTAYYTHTAIAAPTQAAVLAPLNDGMGYGPSGAWQVGASLAVSCAYSPDRDFTTTNLSALGPASNAVVLQQQPGQPPGWTQQVSIQVPMTPDPRAKWVMFFASLNGGALERCSAQYEVANIPTQAFSYQPFLGGNRFGTPYPGANPRVGGPIHVTIDAGPVGTTGRKLYRTIATGATPLKYVATVTDQARTVVVDTLVDTSLGANAPTTNTATAAQVQLSGIPIGPASVTGRRIYRSFANTSTLQLLNGIPDNVGTTFLDTVPDAATSAPPTSDTSGLQQPAGMVLAGAATMVVAGAGWAQPAGGWAIIGNGQQTIRYTGISGNTLTGIPATGPGAITASVSYNSTVTGAALLLGVTGLRRALIKGAPINLWVERNDLVAQSQIAGRDGTDGIIEHLITDERRGETSLGQLCDADLAQYSQPIQTVPYATRDVKTKSGKPITINLATPAIHVTLTIQDVTITEINRAKGLNPRFAVTASSVRFSIEDILRRLGASLDATS